MTLRDYAEREMELAWPDCVPITFPYLPGDDYPEKVILEDGARIGKKEEGGMKSDYGW